MYPALRSSAKIICQAATLFLLYGTTHIAAQTDPPAKNQASVSDTVILPPDQPDATAADDTSPRDPVKQLLAGLKAAGLGPLSHIALVDATVDIDGCMRPPFQAAFLFSPGTGHTEALHSPAVSALADLLRAQGVTVTILDGAAVEAPDTAEQQRIKTSGQGYNLVFDSGPGRWFATSDEMKACASTDSSPLHTGLPLARTMAALGQDAILAVGNITSESKGASWNIMEVELGSSGNGLDAAKSSATIAADLVLKNGTVPWSGEASAEGVLNPDLAAQSTAKLKSHIEQELAKLKQWQKAHPDQRPPDDMVDDKTFNAISNGDLDSAPAGTTLGPSVLAVERAAVQRLIDQLRPAFVVK